MSGSSDLSGFELRDDVRTTPCQAADVVLSDSASCLVFDVAAFSATPCQDADELLSERPGCFDLVAAARAPGMDVDTDRVVPVCCCIIR